VDYESGEFGRGGQIQCAVELVFRGALGEPFVNFAIARAHRLSLRGWISPGTETVKISAEGPQALVDAFEIACSLGPVESNVDDWSRQNRDPGLNAAGFERRP
jgi:acylphosphatase